MSKSILGARVFQPVDLQALRKMPATTAKEVRFEGRKAEWQQVEGYGWIRKHFFDKVMRSLKGC